MNTDTLSAQIQDKSKFSGVSFELSASANDIMNRTQLDDISISPTCCKNQRLPGNHSLLELTDHVIALKAFYLTVSASDEEHVVPRLYEGGNATIADLHDHGCPTVNKIHDMC